MKIILSLLLPMVALATPSLRAENVQATVISTSGNTQYSDASGKATPLKAGLMLSPGARITTDQTGLAILLLADGSKLSLGPNTDLTLTEMTRSGDAHTNVFDVIRGLIRASV